MTDPNQNVVKISYDTIESYYIDPKYPGYTIIYYKNNGLAKLPFMKFYTSKDDQAKIVKEFEKFNIPNACKENN
ncbi:MAG: hypothetical protein Satyrvirus3_30 [Satyrvirus sp.]|uniref:Uncharacterized protein n=1 Tax=Satyrvirus sp. TaxID=2487771 RepID=A0A3G5AI69_9VIRU|nr:MAG: hypothetical protein Satyrvirus3_30 [Satyrvirus sp.]